jgi:predicted acyltransferase
MGNQVEGALAEAGGRIVSMDQFRGYCVLGMWVVNFLSGFAAIHPILKHNNTYFSYADSIMPAFLFAAGFSYRLTLLRRAARDGRPAAYRHAILRSLALILLSLTLSGVDPAVRSWGQMTGAAAWEFVAKLLKADLWNVLAIIGAVQLLVLPVAAASAWARVVTIAVFIAGHAALSYAFNYEFVYGRPNWMDAYWGAAGTRAWDGGFFGQLMWSVPLLGGTLAYDIVSATGPRGARVRRLVSFGAALMACGYGLSCLAMLYEASPGQPAPVPHPSPVKPPFERFGVRPLTALLADPPFVAPPPPEVRPLSYWTMDKRMVTPSFILFATGFALALYGGFVLACDLRGWQSNTFRMLGQNPLLAYLLHYPVERSVHAVMPDDCPWWWCLLGLALFLAIMLLFVRYLDRRKLYLRL